MYFRKALITAHEGKSSASVVHQVQTGVNGTLNIFVDTSSI
jgi:hypothetical protein